MRNLLHKAMSDGQPYELPVLQEKGVIMVLIDNCENLLNDIEEYCEMFPKSYTTYKGIINNLETPRKDLIYDGKRDKTTDVVTEVVSTEYTTVSESAYGNTERYSAVTRIIGNAINFCHSLVFVMMNTKFKSLRIDTTNLHKPQAETYLNLMFQSSRNDVI